MSVHPLPSNLHYIPMSWFSWVHQAVMVHDCDGVLVRRDKTNESHRECAFLKKKNWIINRVNNVSEPPLQIYKLTMFQSDQCWNFCCFIAYRMRLILNLIRLRKLKAQVQRIKAFQMKCISLRHTTPCFQVSYCYFIG